jgi:hypothetical protein
MAQNPFSLTPDDVALDEQGRVIVNNPELAARIKAAKPAPPKPEPTNGNCNGCTTNTVAHCGVKLQ